MRTSEIIKAILQLSGHKQFELAQYFGMTAQSMNNKFSRNSWSVSDLSKVASFCGCRIAFVLPDGGHFFLDDQTTQSKDSSE